MASLSMAGTGNPKDITNTLIKEIENSAMSCELVERISRTLDDMTYDLLVFEKYYMRTGRVSLSVCVVGKDGTIFVDAVGSGEGALIKSLLGAEENFVNVVLDVLGQCGFSQKISGQF